ncbi:hypothetical protein BSZ35_05925 [Salinibacter sp. 10B]|uniref:S41 family peptidase n=1 Tax=Salinibacter sp. 10B TaxID=1923971 RepID=UPI000CF4F6A7|nr:S41 family peptidase [Salinibacter sp. 10B]PQJ34200.1 hypothetical protein BSZ35_05925 [Salinibacter sp. 10B]
MKRTTFALVGIGLVLLGAVLGQWVHDVSLDDSEPTAVRTLENAYDIIRSSYVEPVPPGSLTTASIEAMLKPLDRYSVYISPEQMRRVEETFQGSFEGIGITYELIDGPNGQDTIAVTSVLSGGPSAEAGLRAGDRIVEVNGTSAVGWSHERIRTRLKGPKGSTVSVTLRRPAHPNRIEAQITRDTVPLETVDAAYMVSDRTGYVKLSRFARTTHRELTDALKMLEDNGMDRLVLDLRGNAGGLMSMAEKVADEFLVDGQMIVTARSRHDEFGSVRYATGEGRFEQSPLIVLVDGRSASASEIVAGALQDHDRALLVGERTFGKGLVQRQFPLRGDSGLRLTVARFYTPSGRRVQRSEEDDSLGVTDSVRSLNRSEVPDSLVYHTDAGRAVIGGGGIQPDETVDGTQRNAYRRAVEARGLIRAFARQWGDAHADSLRSRWGGRPEAFATQFQLPTSVYPAFVRHAAEQGAGTMEAQSVPAETHAGDPSGQATRTQMPTRIREAQTGIETMIKSHIGRRLFGLSMFFRVQNTTDPVLEEALRSWPTAERWSDRYPVQ